jgi:hypothetical protein
LVLRHRQKIVCDFPNQGIEREGFDIAKGGFTAIGELSQGFDEDSHPAHKLQAFPQRLDILVPPPHADRTQFQRTLKPGKRLVQSVKEMRNRAARLGPFLV